MNLQLCSGPLVKYEYVEADGDKSARLTFYISVYTGQKKLPDEQYAPTNLTRGTVWGETAEREHSRLEDGTKYWAEAAGLVGALRPYASGDGELKCSMELHRVFEFKSHPQVDRAPEARSSAASEDAPKAIKSKKDKDVDVPF